MSRQRPLAASLAGPASPCIKICTLDAEGYCVGCLRTGDEIGRWISMSAEEQWQLIAVLEERRKVRTQPPPERETQGGTR
jgi:predicted Fe-S protein YdhL (DUF1289 family)